jgi:hypothetical protein
VIKVRYDNVFSATPQRVVEFSFESLEEAGPAFRPEGDQPYLPERAAGAWH